MNGVQLLLVMAGALAVAAIAHRRGFQPGVVTVMLGALVSFVPGLPRLQLDPDLILGVVVPPLLYSATLNFPLFAFLQNLRGILGLGVGLVVFTTIVVGFLTSWLAPELGLAGAFVLAAVVSPPDTVTTVSHGKSLGLPQRIVSILTGESLVNDAAALTLFALAVSAVTGKGSFISNPFLLFGWEAVVALLLGLTIGLGLAWIRSRVGDPTIESGLNLLVPFLAYLAAEQLHASGIIAVVAAGFTVSIQTNRLDMSAKGSSTAYRKRLQEAALWPVIDLALETFVFAYMGLQLRFVLDDLTASASAVPATVGLGLMVLVAVILCRFVWVYVSYSRYHQLERSSQQSPDHVQQERIQKHRPQMRLGSAPPRRQGGQERRDALFLTRKERLLVAWTGMRGIITLAAAGAVPETLASGAPFPGRTEIQTVAFIVAIGTLLIQGATLPLLAKWLNIDLSRDDTAWENALTFARGVATEVVAGANDPSERDYFDRQRKALSRAVIEHRVDPVTFRQIIHEIDLREAAARSTAA